MIALELFSCAGGMAEGFRRAGLEFTWAVDFEPDHCDSYERNLGHRPIRMDVRDLLRMVRTGWRPPRLDLLVADPPCTPWSMAGKRLGLDDPRDMLRPTLDLIELLAPRAWMIANVPGLDSAANWRRYVQPLLGGLAARGGWCLDYASLDAASYGVPQHRVRPFWWAHPEGSPCVRWPEPTHGPPELGAALPGMTGLRPWVTALAGLAHIPRAEWGRPVRLRRRNCSTTQHGSVEDRPARVIGTSNLSDGNVLLGDDAPRRTRGGRSPRASRPDAPAGVVTSRENQGDGCVLMVHPRHPLSDAGRPARTVTSLEGGGAKGSVLVSERAMAWPWARPATTVTQDARIPSAGHHDERGSYQSEGVLLGPMARAALQGFPPEWHFAGRTKRAVDSQIGQAMPPPLAEAVARAVLRAIGGEGAAPVRRT